MRPPFLEALFRTSSSEVAPPTSNSDANSSVKCAREHSIHESYTKILQLHDAIFRI